MRSNGCLERPCRRLRRDQANAHLAASGWFWSRAFLTSHSKCDMGPGRTGSWCHYPRSACCQDRHWDVPSKEICSGPCTDAESTPRWTLLLVSPSWLAQTSRFLNVLCLPSRLHCCNSAAVDMTSADKQLHLDERQNAIARKMRKAEPDATAKFLKRTRRCPDDDFRSLLAPAAASDNDDPSRAEAVFFDCWSAPPAHRIHQVASDLQYNCEKRNVLLTKAQPRL